MSASTRYGSSFTVALVVPDLKPVALDRFDEVEVVRTSDLAEDDVVHPECGRIHGATVQSWPDLIFGFMEWPRGRNETVSPSFNFSM